MDSIFDEVSTLNQTHHRVDFDDVALLKLAKSHCSDVAQDNDIEKGTGVTAEGKEGLPITISDYTLNPYKVEPVTFSSVIDAISNVGIHPTALSTEIVIKVLTKMDAALDNLLSYPTAKDYSELLYRFDFLKSYEGNIHKI